MTYNHEKKPWTIAQRIDLCTLQEIAMASALPIVTPARAASRVRDMTTPWNLGVGGAAPSSVMGPLYGRSEWEELGMTEKGEVVFRMQPHSFRRSVMR